MLAKQLLFLSSLVPILQAQETVLGVYIFHRHGDRTSKNFAPTSLTDLGYSQVYAAGDFYRNRYIDTNASSKIFGISSDLVKNSQLSVQAPVDTVLQNSAAGFLQGLYPPVGATLGTQTLANGTHVEVSSLFLSMPLPQLRAVQTPRTLNGSKDRVVAIMLLLAPTITSSRKST